MERRETAPAAARGRGGVTGNQLACGGGLSQAQRLKVRRYGSALRVRSVVEQRQEDGAVRLRAETLDQDPWVVARGVRQRLPAGRGEASQQRDVFLEERAVPLIPLLA